MTAAPLARSVALESIVHLHTNSPSAIESGSDEPTLSHLAPLIQQVLTLERQSPGVVELVHEDGV